MKRAWRALSTTPALFALVAVALVATTARAAPGPGFLWRTLETRLCNVHFHVEVEREARRIAAMCDEAIEVSTAFLRSTPSEKTEVIVVDTDDRANGFARTVPYNLVTILTIAPDGRSELSHTEDHLRLVLFHEMLHVVHLETTSGLPDIVNRTLGKSWPPNLLQPRFVVEGLAVFTESRVTDGGRLRTERFTAPLRVAALEGDLWSLDDLSNFSRRPPAGGAAYLYGGAFVAWLARRHGEALFARQAHEAGGHMIPYALARSFRAADDDVFLSKEYERFLDALRTEAEAVRARVVARGGPSPARRLTRLGGAVSTPRFDDDGTLLFVSDAPNELAGVMALRGLPSATPTPEAVARAPSPTGVAPLDDGRLAITRGELNDGALAFQDLFVVERDGSVRTVTRGARVRDPVAVAGTSLVVVERRAGHVSAVSIVDVDTGAITDLVSYDDGTQLYAPRPSPDGRHVVVSRLSPGGRRTLVELSREDGALRELAPSAADDADPSYTIDGRYVLFSSNRVDGVFNIFALERETERVYRVTDTLGLASQPMATPDGRAVVYVDVTTDGTDLYAAPLVIDASREVNGPTPPAPTHRPRASVDDEAHIYNPLPTLLPRTWTPLMATDQAGAPALGLSLAGEDAVGLFSWSMQGTYGVGQMRPRLSGTLRFDGPFVPLTAFAEWRTDDTLIRTERDVDVPVRQTVLRASGSLSLPFRRVLRSHAVSLGYSRSLYLDETPPPGTPDGPMPRVPPPPHVGALSLTWTYSDLRRFRDSISSEDGQSLTVQLSGANALTLSPLHLYEISFAARVYRPVPGLSRHVVSLLVEGGFAQGERLRRTNWRLGGITDRDFTRDVVSQVRFGDGVLRGYGANSDVGDAYYLASVEYRVPILEVERGVESLPLFVSRVQGAVFADVGDAFDGVPTTHGARAGVGAELQVRFTLAYYGFFFLRAGYARGLMVTGMHQPYVVLGIPL